MIHMTTVELKNLKMDLLEEVIAIDNQEILKKVQSYLKRLKKKEAALNAETLQAMADVKAGNMTHCVSFDDYLKAVR